MEVGERLHRRHVSVSVEYTCSGRFAENVFEGEQIVKEWKSLTARFFDGSYELK
jgi:hypothetical protein